MSFFKNPFKSKKPIQKTLSAVAINRTKSTKAQDKINEAYKDGNGNLAKSTEENSLHTSELVFSCVDYISKAASQATPRLYSVTANSKEEKPVKNKKLQAWLQKPNPFWCWGDIIEVIIQELLLSGSGYMTLETNKGVLESWVLPSPSNMEVVPDAKKFIAGFLYNKKIAYKPNEVCMFRNPTLNNAFYGLPAVKPLIDTLKLEGSSIDELYSFYTDSTILSGVLQSETFVSPEQTGELREQFNALYKKGGSGHRGVAVLPYKMAYSPIQANPKDSLLLDSINVSAQRVMRVFKVNALVLGGENTSTTHPMELMKVVYNTAVRPYLYRIQDQLTLFLRNTFKDDTLFFKFDFDRVVELDTSLDIKASSAKTLYTTGVASLNEARDLVGLPKLTEAAADKNVLAAYLLGTGFSYIQDLTDGVVPTATATTTPQPAGSTDPSGGAADLTQTTNTGATNG